jgi:hypothetical protein
LEEGSETNPRFSIVAVANGTWTGVWAYIAGRRAEEMKIIWSYALRDYEAGGRKVNDNISA